MNAAKFAITALLTSACASTVSTESDDASESSAETEPASTWCCSCVRVGDCRSLCMLVPEGECEDRPSADGCIGSTFETPDIDGLPDCGSQTPDVDGDLVGCPLACVENIP